MGYGVMWALCSFPSIGTLFDPTLGIELMNGLLFCLQEMLLKRAADLVEALYGNPHSNQVNKHLNTSQLRVCKSTFLNRMVSLRSQSLFQERHLKDVTFSSN